MWWLCCGFLVYRTLRSKGLNLSLQQPRWPQMTWLACLPPGFLWCKMQLMTCARCNHSLPTLYWVLVRGAALGMGWEHTGFIFWVEHWLVMGPSQTLREDLTFLKLSFSIYKMGIWVPTFLRLLWELNQMTPIKSLEQCLLHICVCVYYIYMWHIYIYLNKGLWRHSIGTKRPQNMNYDPIGLNWSFQIPHYNYSLGWVRFCCSSKE